MQFFKQESGKKRSFSVVFPASDALFPGFDGVWNRATKYRPFSVVCFPLAAHCFPGFDGVCAD